MIVVDTNIISYLYLPTKYSVQTEQLMSLDSDWTAPLLWKSEFRNLLALYLRQGIVTLDHAFSTLQEAEELFLDREFQVNSLTVMNLVAQSDCSAYDCEFVALAKDIGISLVTQDKKILRAFPEVAFSLESYLAPYV